MLPHRFYLNGADDLFGLGRGPAIGEMQIRQNLLSNDMMRSEPRIVLQLLSAYKM
ncbi:MAG: hypothetical protein WC761_00035 [Candidatus Paceibacterota bacterium]